jgi:hypothetical protein
VGRRGGAGRGEQRQAGERAAHGANLAPLGRFIAGCDDRPRSIAMPIRAEGSRVSGWGPVGACPRRGRGFAKALPRSPVIPARSP